MTAGSESQSGWTVIRPPSGIPWPDLRELWGARDLLVLLARRDVVSRYKQTAAGALWAILQPLLLAIVFSVFLGLLAKVPSQKGIAYPLFAICGLTIWLPFTQMLVRASTSTLAASPLIGKVYFPRLTLPIAALFAPAFDFLFAMVILIGALFVYGMTPSITILVVPLALALAVMVALGAGLWLSAAAVRYRDVEVLVPFLIQVALFMTPVIYPLALVPHNLQPIYAINPMVGVLELFRWAVLPGVAFPGLLLLIPILSSIILIVGGLLVFTRAERSFGDLA
jgi:lipopolysaccharide transport system permease protein